MAALIITAALVVGSSVAELLPSEDYGSIAAAETCPELFGALEAREELSAWRKERLEILEVGPHCVDLVHSTEWDEPEVGRIEGIDVLHGAHDGALVLVSDHLAEDVGCVSGVYLLPVDATLGDWRALATLPAGLLLGNEETLVFVPAEDAAQVPAFRVWWHAPWSIARPAPVSSKRPAARPRRSSRRR